MDPISSSEKAADLAVPPTAHSFGQENIVIFYQRRKKIAIYSWFTVIFPTETFFSKRNDVACLPFINDVEQQHARQYIWEEGLGS